MFNQLDCNQSSPLILVAAPAGFGKSTLLAIWLGAVDCPNTWISLDENDNNLDDFLMNFLAAIESLFPGTVNETMAMLRVRESPALRDLVSVLNNELNSIGQNFILVLDDYHYITEAVIHDLVNQLLLYPPKGMKIVLSTRSDPPLSLARLRSKGLLTEIRTHSLRFTKDETEILLEQLLRTSIDKEDVKIIDYQFEGWVTGLRLAALTMRDPSRVAQIIEGEHLTGNCEMTEYLIVQHRHNLFDQEEYHRLER